MLTIVIPAYNEAGNIENTTKTIINIVDKNQIKSEIVFIDDGSLDNTYQEICKMHNKYDNVHGVQFSRNFGKESAILAGLAAGKGDCFVVMDCDLQHPPQKIPEMYECWRKGYEIVEGKKKNRGRETKIHKFFSKLFYSILSKATGFDMMNSGDFKLIDKKVAQLLVKLPESRTFFRGLTFWTGYKSCEVEYYVEDRKMGTSKWNMCSLVKYAIKNIMSFSSAPLNFVTYIGGATELVVVIVALNTIIQWLQGSAVEGFTTVILLILFFGGIILLSLGLIGAYIAAIYEEIKGRPKYIIEKQTD